RRATMASMAAPGGPSRRKEEQATMAGYLFENAGLLDTAAGEIRTGSSVRIEGDRIVDVAVEQSLRAGDNVRRIDVRGPTLMPGLIDAHLHALITSVAPGAADRPVMLIAMEARALLERMLRRGFTTVRDVAGAVRGLSLAMEKGLFDGPRLFYSGRALSQTG